MKRSRKLSHRETWELIEQKRGKTLCAVETKCIGSNWNEFAGDAGYVISQVRMSYRGALEPPESSKLCVGSKTDC